MTEQQDAQPGPWATAMYVLVCAVAITACLFLVVSAGYAIALHGLSG